MNNIKKLDINKWHRKSHFEFFQAFEYPQFNISANLLIQNFLLYCKKREISSFAAMLYLVSKAANNIEAFRMRITDNDEIIIHDVVHPSFTVINDKEVFNFCDVHFSKNTKKFIQEVKTASENARNQLDLIDDPPGRTDNLFITCIPWVSFTSIQHPIRLGPKSSVPMIAWGKYTTGDSKQTVPFSVQGNHSLMDGIHIGKFYNMLQEYLDDPFSCLQI